MLGKHKPVLPDDGRATLEARQVTFSFNGTPVLDGSICVWSRGIR